MPPISEPSPRVTVVVTTYNRSALLQRAIASILNQTYQDFELIVVDDGGSDDTESVVKGIGDTRISYIKHARNQGPAAARNTGTKMARGTYVAYQDDDNEWFPTKLEKQVAAMDAVPADVAAVYTPFIKKHGDVETRIPAVDFSPKSGDILRPLLHGNFIDLPTILVRREIFQTIGFFDERLRNLEDWEFLLRIAAHKRFICVDEVLMISHWTANSVNQQNHLGIPHAEYVLYVLREHHETFKLERFKMARYYFFCGRIYFRHGELRKGSRCVLEAAWIALTAFPRRQSPPIPCATNVTT